MAAANVPATPTPAATPAVTPSGGGNSPLQAQPLRGPVRDGARQGVSTTTTDRPRLAATAQGTSSPGASDRPDAEGRGPEHHREAEPAAESHHHHHQERPLLPGPDGGGSNNNSSGSTTTTTVTVDGAAVALDHLGPLVVHADGTLSRVANWAEMTEPERRTTVRVLGRRNRARLEALRGGGGGGGGEASG